MKHKEHLQHYIKEHKVALVLSAIVIISLIIL